MPTTLADIATRLKVAKSTVSLVLRDHPRAQHFSPAMRQRIVETARELDYRPNLFATGLSGGRTRLLMLCLSTLQDAWAAMVAEGFEHRATERNYRMLINAFHDKEDPMALHRDILGAQGVRAIAVIGQNREKLTDEGVVKLADAGIRVALVGRFVDDERIAIFQPDNAGGARLAAEHLYSQGIDDIWIVTSPSPGPAAERSAAFEAISVELGRKKPRTLVIHEKGHHRASYQLVRQALERFPPPRGLFACGDITAIGAVQALHEAGLIVGRDVAVVGFDGGVFSECCVPPLTSVRQPMKQMGRMAADALIDMLEKPDFTALRVMFPLDLIVRQSSILRGRPAGQSNGTMNGDESRIKSNGAR